MSNYKKGEKRGSQIEGTFYKKELFSKICSIITDAYDYREMTLAYPREEIYFSTVLYCLMTEDPSIKRLDGCKFTLMKWNYALMASISDVKKLRKTNTNYYSVKRVERTLDDFVRKYIMITGGYYDEELSYNPKLKKNLMSCFIKYLKQLWQCYNTRLRVYLHNLKYN